MMTFPVFVEPCEGRFAATLVGTPNVRGVASTRDEAVAVLKSQLAERFASESCSPSRSPTPALPDWRGSMPMIRPFVDFLQTRTGAVTPRRGNDGLQHGRLR